MTTPPPWHPDLHEGRTLALEMRTSAPPAAVWAAWTDPERIAQWFVDRAEGRPEPGTTFTWFFDAFGYAIPYQVLDARPPAPDPDRGGSLFVLGGQLPDRPPFALEVTIRQEGGETVLRLVNSGFLHGGAWDEEYEGVASGWEMALGLLAYYLERHVGEPKRTFLEVRPAPLAPGASLDWFTRPELLARWLTRDGEPGVGAPGEAVSLALRDGGRLAGRVLARTRREVALGLDDLPAVVELKAFAGRGGRMVGVRGTAWGMDEGRFAALAAAMGDAAARLAGAAAESPPAAA
jgi:uncharacterized protein YndB with AHSA1/START domain